MLRKIGIILLTFIIMLTFSVTTVMGIASEENDEIVETNIQDNNDVLLNPGKGLVYYARRLTFDDEHKYPFDWVSQEMLNISQVIYTRYDWSELQKEEGIFDFTLIDEGIKDCIKYNKKFAFGVMCADVSTEEPYVTPKFVFDKGAKYKLGGTNGKQYIPDWKDETFIKYVNEFTKALGEKYNADPNIAFIDIRSYGNYGEQHLYGLDVLDQSGKKMDEHEYIRENRVEPEFLKEQYIKPYIEAFPDTLLIIPWGEDCFNNVYEELIDEGVSLRRDGIITYTNGLETCAKTYGKLPMVFEYASKYGEYEKEDFNSKLEEAMQMCKPSYIELDKEWYKDGNQEYCKELANRIGYYFRLKKATYHKNITANEPTEMSFEFKNDGITPISEDCSVYVGLLDQNNQLIKKYKTNINPKNWEPDIIIKEEVSVTFENVDSGNYKLAIGLYKNDEDKDPTYLLGSDGKTENNWYVCGEIELKGNNKYTDIYDYTEKIMENPPSITKINDEKNLEDSTIWYKPKTEDGKVNLLYKSYNSNLEPVSWRDSIIGQNSIYSKNNKWPQLYSVEFVVNCKEFFVNTCTSFRILVDEGNGYEITNRDGIEQTTKETGSDSDAFKGKWFKVEFNEKKERKIRVELTDCVFNGVRISRDDEIKAIDRQSNLKVLYVGSSITRGGDLAAYYSWPNVTSNILNLECINNGVGGTGYVADTKGKNDIYSERLEILIEQLKLNPDVIVLEAGPNDYWSGYKAPEVIAEAEKCIDYIKNNTNAKIITIGAYYPDEKVLDDLIEINNKLKEQAFEKKVPFIDLLNGDTYNEDGEKITIGKEAYITGTGDMGNPKNDGNADDYILEDGVHLSVEGNKYFGEKLAVEIGKILGIKPTTQKFPNIVSLYCWDIDDFNVSKLKDEIDCLGINTLYIQRPANDSQINRLKEIMEFAKQYELDVFLLEGARDWLTEGDMNNVIDVINDANELNKILNYKLKGVSLDVEFYLTDEYQNAANEEDVDKQLSLFRQFTENTKKCCDYAESLDLKYSMALPVWLDKLSEEILEDLMNYNYDHIAFMNYFKETIMENMDQEVEIAKKHNIKIISIAEVQNPEFGTVGEEDTFYYDGLEQCINTLNDIREKYNYNNLGISYHYYKPLLSLLERDTNVGIENKYELQIFPYINETNIKVDKAQIICNGIKFEPIYFSDIESGKNAVIFYGLEYGKQYELKIESEDYSITKTFTYQKGDNIFNELEIAYMDVMLEGTKQEEKDPDVDKDKPDQNEPNKDNQNENKPDENVPGTDEQDKTETDKPENSPNKEEQNKEDLGEDNTSDKDDIDNSETNISDNENNKNYINENKSEADKNKENLNDDKKDKNVSNKKDNLATSKIPQTGDNIILANILFTAIGIILIFNIILTYKIIKSKGR